MLSPVPTAVQWVGFHFCLFVFPDDISKPDAARIIKLDIQMFHHESWKLIYLGVKGQGHNVCVCLQTERSIATAAAYVNSARFSLL